MRSHRGFILTAALAALACATSKAPAPEESTPPTASNPEPTTENEAVPEDPATPTCPPDYVQAAQTQHGLCLEPGLLGEDVTNACIEVFEANGYVPDPDAQAALEEASGKPLRCYVKSQ